MHSKAADKKEDRSTNGSIDRHPRTTTRCVYIPQHIAPIRDPRIPFPNRGSTVSGHTPTTSGAAPGIRLDNR